MAKRKRLAPSFATIPCPGRCLIYFPEGRALSNHIATSPSCQKNIAATAQHNRDVAFEPDDCDEWPTCQEFDPNDNSNLQHSEDDAFPFTFFDADPNSGSPSSPKRPRFDSPEPPILDTTTPDGPDLIIEPYIGAGATYGPCVTPWEELQQNEPDHDNPNAPYWASHAEWDIARWLGQSGLPMTKINSFLKTHYTSQQPLSFKMATELRQKIEDLPGAPRWKHRQIILPESPNEQHTLFYRDIFECIDYLIANPAFKESIAYSPVKHYRPKLVDGEYVKNVEGQFEKGERVFSEMFTADKWHEVQSALPPGVTVCPILLASDATHITNFSGDGKVHPLYISIGNIHKAVRSKTNSHAFLVLAYLPVSKFPSVPDPRAKAHKATLLAKKKKKNTKSEPNPMQGILKARLFHCCLKLVLAPLHIQQTTPRQTHCSDGFFRQIVAFLAAYIADMEEQWLIGCLRGCLQCMNGFKNLGDRNPGTTRTAQSVLDTIHNVQTSFPMSGHWHGVRLQEGLRTQ